jgi:hypothetical protein
MATMPNADQAVVDDDKLSAYLLNVQHPLGGPKARFFMRFGFAATEPQTLREALLRHGRTHETAGVVQRPHGMVYLVEGPIGSPDERTPWVRTAWMIRPGEDFPRLVTAYPMEAP